MRESLRYPPFLANGSSFQNLSAAARSGSSSSSAVPMLSAPSAERIGPRKMKLSPYDAKYELVRVQVLAEELGRAGLGSRAQELLHALAAIVGRALLEAVRPAVNLDALVEAGLAHGLARDECVRRRAVVELHEERRAQRVAPVVGDEMAVADDALAEILHVALLVLQQGAPGGLRPRLVPAIDRPLGRLRAVVVPQRLPAQSIARIARQISGHVCL